MKKAHAIVLAAVMVLLACGGEVGEHEEATEVASVAAEATSFFGEALYPAEPSTANLEKLEAARRDWQAGETVDTAIWLGRRTAYLGRYNEAIEIYSTAIERWPGDARLYRHRGHRYISSRQLDLAITDFSRAAELIEGTEDEIEPDGMPNARNIPVSSLHTNTWYHLGLAHYLKGQFPQAIDAYRKCLEASRSPDNVVSTTHWLYMALRKLGRSDEAVAALESINAEMDIIENMAYHQLCLFYKGEIDEAALTGAEHGAIMNAATAYGLGNWHLAEGNVDRAREIFEEILAGDGWAAFGYIAAEADMARGLEEAPAAEE